MSAPGETMPSPTKTLIQKFNTLGQHSGREVANQGQGQSHRKAINVHSNPVGSPSHQMTNEPMYATIGSKNRSINRLAGVKPAQV